MSDFPKQYDPKSAEAEIQKLWKEHHIWAPRESRSGKTFYIPIPPPNVTGNLHLGHALTLTLEDIMVRYHRMKWDATLWVPGTDHAGIATQAQVEKRLEKQGTSRKTLGREKFLEACRDWVSEYGGNIQNQMGQMGASVSWEHERYTFDEKSNHLVEDTFVDLYNKWLIYRWEYMVNYSPVLESVISDIEVEYQELDEKMYYINYFVSGSDKEILVATTRPETLLADQAVAVHPKDKRYKKLIGRSVVLPIVNKEIPIIADEMVDMEFGTGAVKITPAHDPADFEFAKRHNLRTNYQVIDKNGYMTKEAGTFEWQIATEEARSNIVELLRAKGNLVKIEPYRHKVGYCSRGKCRVESVVSTQWFVRAWEMAKKVIAGYEKDEFEIIPSRYEKVFEDWIYHLRDWCISRQLWWWHQIPAYYDANTGELLGVTRDPSEIIQAQAKKYGIALSRHREGKGESEWSEERSPHGGWSDPDSGTWTASYLAMTEKKRQELLAMTNTRRDDDVLDTWFSSGLWPFSVLDWSYEHPWELFKKYYPADVLETGHDILFFWVIRMLLMGYEMTGETPFGTIYLHGLILDEHGKKMSKSWGNVIDPLEVISEYSTDALRLALVLGNTPWNNLNFSKNTVKEYGLFLNKLWNIVRFTWMNVGDITEDRATIEKRIEKNRDQLLPYESWILSRLARTIDAMSQGMEDFSFSASGMGLLSFIRDEFADFAIEAYKIEKENSTLGADVMKLCILDILTLLHPYAPHITEMLYGHLTGGKILTLSEWAETRLTADDTGDIAMTRISEVIRTLRNLRRESGINPGEYRTAHIFAPKLYEASLIENTSLIKGLARLDTLTFDEKETPHPGYAYTVIDSIEVFIDAAIDETRISLERERLEKERAIKNLYIRTLGQKLKNTAFISNAPESVVRKEMDKLHQAREELRKLEEKISR
jgi:valyl-tRNA synthetase